MLLSPRSGLVLLHNLHEPPSYAKSSISYPTLPIKEGTVSLEAFVASRDSAPSLDSLAPQVGGGSKCLRDQKPDSQRSSQRVTVHVISTLPRFLHWHRACRPVLSCPVVAPSWNHSQSWKYICCKSQECVVPTRSSRAAVTK